MSLVLGKQRREFETVSNSRASFSLEQMLKTSWIDIELSRVHIVDMSYYVLVSRHAPKKKKNMSIMSCVAISNDNNAISAQHAPDMQRVFKTSVRHLHKFVQVLFNTSSKLPQNLCKLWRLLYKQLRNIGDLLQMSGGLAWDRTFLKKSLRFWRKCHTHIV
jgi:hypothetical protein